MAYNVFTPVDIYEPRFETDEEGFRIFPEHEDSRARIAFELYGHGEQNRLITMGMATASGALAGASAGPVGIFVGSVLGALGGYWKIKAYRSQRYAAYMQAGGIIERRRVGSRSLFYRNPDEYGWRYPYGDMLADVIVDTLSKDKPQMGLAELRAMGAESLRVFKNFRMSHPDIPLELAADTILAHYGIVRQPEAQNGHIYDPHTAYRIIHPPPPAPNGGPGEAKNNWLLYAGGAAVALFLLTRR